MQGVALPVVVGACPVHPVRIHHERTSARSTGIAVSHMSRSRSWKLSIMLMDSPFCSMCFPYLGLITEECPRGGGALYLNFTARATVSTE